MRYFNMTLKQLRGLERTKLAAIRALQEKGYLPHADRQELRKLSEQVYYIKQAIKSHEQQESMF